MSTTTTPSPIPEGIANDIDRLRAPLIRYLRRSGADPATAEDLTSTVIVRTIERCTFGGGPPQDLSPYLFRAAHNAYVDHCRTLSHRSVVTWDFAVSESWFRDLTQDPAELVVNEVALEQALTLLPARYRTAITLIASGCSTEEIVALMDLPTANCARVLVFRARQALKKVFLRCDGRSAGARART